VKNQRKWRRRNQQWRKGMAMAYVSAIMKSVKMSASMAKASANGGGHLAYQSA
jgi:hypothetical protein